MLQLRLTVVASHAAAAIALVLFTIAGPASAAAASMVPERADFVQYEAGQLPLIFTVPHGGREKPATLADRRRENVDMDRNTVELAREIVAELKRRTGRTPHLIVSLLHRIKLDPNRDIDLAAQGDRGAERVWRRFHACVDQAKRAALAGHGFAFLVDVHGHSHPIARLELGYALSAAEINLTDAELDAGDAGQRSSLGNLPARTGQGIAALIRGPSSLGALLEKNGVAVIPSPGSPRPLAHPYYSGSYILRHHASAKFPGVDGVQMECNYPGVRDTPANRARLARAFVDSLTEFLVQHYRYTLPAQSLPPDK